MAKFQNMSGFKQVVTINGAKTLIFPEDVIEMRDSWLQAGFDKVPDDTPVRITERTSRRSFASNDMLESLQERLRELEGQEDTENKLGELSERLESLSDDALIVGEDVKKDVSELRDLVSALKDQQAEQKQVNDTILRRLEILKTAIQAMEYELDQFYADDSSGN